jgi:hypothetical protein
MPDKKILNCPVCLGQLEEPYDGLLSCYMCMVNVDPKTGEITRMRNGKGIIKNVLGKLKYFLWL